MRACVREDVNWNDACEDRLCSAGAGDALVAGCCAGLLAGLDVETAAAVGVAASRRAVESDANVPVGPSVAYEALLGDARQVMGRVGIVHHYSRAPRRAPLTGCG